MPQGRRVGAIGLTIAFFIGVTTASSGVDVHAQEDGPPSSVPDRFRVDLFADFAEFGRLKAFDLAIHDGQGDFPAGLYVTSGPTGDDRSDRLIRIDQEGAASVVTSGLRSNESLLFASEEYGGGLLVTQPLEQRIIRVDPEGEYEEFARVGGEPFGPAALFTDEADNLYVTDFASSTVLALTPDGGAEPVVQLPVAVAPAGWLVGAKGGDDCEGGFCGGGFGGGGAGGDLVIGVFSAVPGAAGVGGIYVISRDPTVAPNLLVGGLDGINLIEWGPGGLFGSDLYVPTVGGAEQADGGLFIWDPVFGLQPFLTGLDAAAVAFDTEGLLGGGMFVSDMNDGGGAAKIWRIRPTG